MNDTCSIEIEWTLVIKPHVSSLGVFCLNKYCNFYLFLLLFDMQRFTREHSLCHFLSIHEFTWTIKIDYKFISHGYVYTNTGTSHLFMKCACQFHVFTWNKKLPHLICGRAEMAKTIRYFLTAIQTTKFNNVNSLQKCFFFIFLFCAWKISRQCMVIIRW